MSVLNFECVGKGDNIHHSDGAIVAFAGWDEEFHLEGAVQLGLGDILKNVRIQAEFRGWSDTRWEGLNKLASRPESNDYRVHRTVKIFQQLVEVVYDSKHPLLPGENGRPISLPFKFKLPSTHLPPSFSSVSGVIEYYIKVSMLYSEGSFTILRKNVELEVPVIVLMPDSAKLRLYATPSALSSDAVGDSLEVNLEIKSTPPNTRLRTVYVSLRPIVSYLNDEGIAARATFPRPMSEVSQTYPLIQVGRGGTVPIRQQFLLDVDPELAQASFESTLISVRTILRLQITLDNPEVPNIAKEFPIVVVPRLSETMSEIQIFNPSTLHRAESLSESFRPASFVGGGNSSMRTPSLHASTAASPMLSGNDLQIPLPVPHGIASPQMHPNEVAPAVGRVFPSPVQQPVYDIGPSSRASNTLSPVPSPKLPSTGQAESIGVWSPLPPPAITFKSPNGIFPPDQGRVATPPPEYLDPHAAASQRSFPLLAAEAGLIMTFAPIVEIFLYRRIDVGALSQRLNAVMKANPWLASRLISGDATDSRLRFSYSADPDASSYLRQHAAPECSLDAAYADMYDAVSPLIPVGTGHQSVDRANALLFSVDLIEFTDGYGLMISLSHVLGDGHTFDFICHMFSTSNSVTPMIGERVQAIAPLADHLFQQYRTWQRRDEPACTGQRDAKLADSCRRMHYGVVRVEEIARRKACAAYRDGEPFVSSNDILTSWYLVKRRPDVALILVNLRGRVDRRLLTDAHAGNYTDVLPLCPETYGTPGAVRRAVTPRGDGIFERVADLPTVGPGRRVSVAIVTNRAGNAEPHIEIQGQSSLLRLRLRQDRVVPVDHHLTIFRSTADRLAVVERHDGAAHHDDEMVRFGHKSLLN